MCLLLCGSALTVESLYVLQAQLAVDDLQVANGVHSVLNVCDVRVLKGTAHMVDAVNSGYMGQESIAQALTLSSTPAGSTQQ